MKICQAFHNLPLKSHGPQITTFGFAALGKIINGFINSDTASLIEIINIIIVPFSLSSVLSPTSGKRQSLINSNNTTHRLITTDSSFKPQLYGTDEANTCCLYVHINRYSLQHSSTGTFILCTTTLRTTHSGLVFFLS